MRLTSSSLESVPVFGGLSQATLDLILARAAVVEVSGQAHFFHENDRSQAMYVLQHGRVEIYKTWRDRSVRLREMTAGDCFGEMALIDFFPRSASARAMEHCRALEITAGILQDIHCHDAEQFTLLQMNMGREVSRRLRALDELIFGISMGEPAPPAELRTLL